VSEPFERETGERLWLAYRAAGVPAVLLLVFAASVARYASVWAPWVIVGLTVLGMLLVLVRRRLHVLPRALEVAVVLCVAAALGVLGLTVVPVETSAVAAMGMLSLAVVSTTRASSVGSYTAIAAGLILGTLILVVHAGFGPGPVASYVGTFLLTMLTVRRLHRSMLEAERRAVVASVTDALTGINNRSSLPAEFARLVAQAGRSTQQVGLVMLDLDHFKLINDEHGHLMGDDVLRQVGDLLHESSRLGDLAVRYGGEEFLLAAVVSDVAEMKGIAERVRSSVAGLPTVQVVTVSAGVTARDPAASDPGPDQLLLMMITEADRALYEAKQAGRNQAIIA